MKLLENGCYFEKKKIQISHLYITITQKDKINKSLTLYLVRNEGKERPGKMERKCFSFMYLEIGGERENKKEELLCLMCKEEKWKENYLFFFFFLI